MGLHLVLSHLLYSPLPRRRPGPPPAIAPLPAAASPRSSRPHPRAPLARHGVNFRRHLPRHPPLFPRRDPGHALVLAPYADLHAAALAALFSGRHSPLRPRFLLVLRLLPLPVPPPSPELLLHPPPPAQRLLPSVCPLRPRMHVVPLARVLAELSGAGHPLRHAGARRRVRVPVLGGRGAAGGGWGGVRGGAWVPAGGAVLQPGLPFWGDSAAFRQGRVQRDWCVALQHRAQRCVAAHLLELLCAEEGGCGGGGFLRQRPADNGAGQDVSGRSGGEEE
ncbi:hypothetical protein KSP39_PZI000260 [Platanthera zijinensis]|uniref:Uncharacterized protein n=1 Tax=Platanthera zijinensis TaxID=2320716 RepID=A0AAP0GFZ0_9ASPA